MSVADVQCRGIGEAAHRSAIPRRQSADHALSGYSRHFAACGRAPADREATANGPHVRCDLRSLWRCSHRFASRFHTVAERQLCNRYLLQSSVRVSRFCSSRAEIGSSNFRRARATASAGDFRHYYLPSDVPADCSPKRGPCEPIEDSEHSLAVGFGCFGFDPISPGFFRSIECSICSLKQRCGFVSFAERRHAQ